jgi:aminoglycoside 3-N-acetyltransferase I
MEARILRPGDEALLAAGAAMIDEDDDLDRLPSPERCRQLLADPCFVATVALEDGRLVGFTYGHVLPQMTRTALLIYSVDTAEAYRRRGAATAMIEALRLHSLERGYYEMWVPTNTSNAAAMGLYAACGGARDDTDEAIFAFPIAG